MNQCKSPIVLALCLLIVALPITSQARSIEKISANISLANGVKFSDSTDKMLSEYNKLSSFSSTVENHKVTLQWDVYENESIDLFQIEKSTNGKDFSAIAVLIASEKAGAEHYAFKNGPTTDPVTYFRLKLLRKKGVYAYSQVIVIKNQGPDNNSRLSLLQNPAPNNIGFNYVTAASTQCGITVYNTLGTKVYNTTAACHEGTNTIYLYLPATLSNGSYVLEVTDNTTKSTKVFIKD